MFLVGCLGHLGRLPTGCQQQSPVVTTKCVSRHCHKFVQGAKLPLVENHCLNQIHLLRWERESYGLLCVGGTERSEQKQRFLRKDEEEVGSVLIFMDSTVCGEGVEKQRKSKLLCSVTRTIVDRAPHRYPVSTKAPFHIGWGGSKKVF